jgi:Ni/Co efflux regulator RcnB
MKRLFITTAIVLGLFAVTPAAFAQGGQNQNDRSDKSDRSDQRDRADKGDKSDQRGNADQGDKSDKSVKSDQGGKTDQGGKSGKSGKSDQGDKSGNARGQNESRTQGDVGNAQNMGTHNAVTTDRTRNMGNTNRTRNVGTTNPTPRTATTSRSRDFKSLRGNVRSSHRFHAGTYHRPHGYHFRHWRYGQRLPSFYFVRDYWIMDYLMYALFAPPDGYIWVRVGDDALLIDEETGEIIRVEYGVFY